MICSIVCVRSRCCREWTLMRCSIKDGSSGEAARAGGRVPRRGDSNSIRQRYRGLLGQSARNCPSESVRTGEVLSLLGASSRDSMQDSKNEGQRIIGGSKPRRGMKWTLCFLFWAVVFGVSYTQPPPLLLQPTPVFPARSGPGGSGIP